MLQPTPVETARRVQQLRSVAICAMFAAFAFLQEPGRIAPDTKLDLVVDPARFLGRALHLWEPDGFFGQVQNQGYGYLFPMGPFFLLGKLAALPPWVVQRLWWTVLLCLAFGGTVRVWPGRCRSAPTPPGCLPASSMPSRRGCSRCWARLPSRRCRWP